MLSKIMLSKIGLIQHILSYISLFLIFPVEQAIN